MGWLTGSNKEAAAAAAPGCDSQRARLHRRRPFTPVLVVSPLVSLAFVLRWIEGSLHCFIEQDFHFRDVSARADVSQLFKMIPGPR